MKALFLSIGVIFMVNACATSSTGARRDPIRECPVGMVLVCESRTQREPSRGGAEEEIPEYEYCRCIQQTN